MMQMRRETKTGGHGGDDDDDGYFWAYVGGLVVLVVFYVLNLYWYSKIIGRILKYITAKGRSDDTKKE